MKDLLIIFGMATLLLIPFYQWLTLPRVYVEYTTGECVKVEPEQAGNCRDLPEKFEVIKIRDAQGPRKRLI